MRLTKRCGGSAEGRRCRYINWNLDKTNVSKLADLFRFCAMHYDVMFFQESLDEGMIDMKSSDVMERELSGFSMHFNKCRGGRRSCMVAIKRKFLMWTGAQVLGQSASDHHVAVLLGVGKGCSLKHAEFHMLVAAHLPDHGKDLCDYIVAVSAIERAVLRQCRQAHIKVEMLQVIAGWDANLELSHLQLCQQDEEENSGSRYTTGFDVGQHTSTPLSTLPHALAEDQQKFLTLASFLSRTSTRLESTH